MGEFADVGDGFVDEMEVVSAQSFWIRDAFPADVGADGGEGLAEFVMEFVGETAGGFLLTLEHVPRDVVEFVGL